MVETRPPYHVAAIVLGALVFELLSPPGKLQFSALLFLSGFMLTVGCSVICKTIYILLNRSPDRIALYACVLGCFALWAVTSTLVPPSKEWLEMGLSEKRWLQGVGIIAGWLAMIDRPHTTRRRKRVTENSMFLHLRAWLQGAGKQRVPIKIGQ